MKPVNVLVPMAGEGSRFSKAGYQRPKPFIDVAGIPMIQWVFENLGGPSSPLNFIVVLRKSHDEKHGLSKKLCELRAGVRVVYADRLTEGAACTTLLAKDLIYNDEPLFIVNSDQFLVWNTKKFWDQIAGEDAEGSDGNIVCFDLPMENNDTKWSYAAVDANGYVSDVQEKKVISRNATVGMYYWTKGSDYVKCAEKMIRRNIRVNGEFYVAPVYNQGVEDGLHFRVSFCEKMYGLGVPRDLTTFLYEYVRPQRLARFDLSSGKEARSVLDRKLRLIAHRGNLSGPNPEMENSPEYLIAALRRGFDVEVDVWFMREEGKWFLGHDAPTYVVDREFLNTKGFWIHCKNGDALQELSMDASINCFFHNIDDFTLTSKGFIWTYPDRPLHGSRAVAVMFSRPQNLLDGDIYGICADNVEELSSLITEKEIADAPTLARITLRGRSMVLVFDLDGVLLESKDIHYVALNRALVEVAGQDFRISRAEHEAIYDGLSTNQKLVMLGRNKRLPEALFRDVFVRKQEISQELFTSEIEPSERMIGVLSDLKELGFPIAVASNCIRASVISLLDGAGLIPFVDCFFSNEDVKNPKPAPDIYSKAAGAFGCSPDQVVVIEDTPKGWTSALRAGANLLKVSGVADVTVRNIVRFVEELESREQNHSLNIVMPMARRTQQFWMDGPTALPVEVPSQICDVGGRTVLEWMFLNMKSQKLMANHILLARESHVGKYDLHRLLPYSCSFMPCKVMVQRYDQLGAAKTILCADSEINNDLPLLIHDCGHLVQWPAGSSGVDDLVKYMTDRQAQAVMVVHEDNDPRWSFVTTKPGSDVVINVKEKEVISSTACTGMYLWAKGSDFVSAAKKMIDRKKTFHGQYFIAPTINICVELGLKVVVYRVPKSWSLRTLREVQEFEEKYLPGVAENELSEIYEEMIERNTRNVLKAKNLVGDVVLGAKTPDVRRCHAVYTMFDKENWKPTPAFSELMNLLASEFADHVIYRVAFEDKKSRVPEPCGTLDGALHTTYMQVVKFDMFDSVAIPSDYCECIGGILVNSLRSFEIRFHSLVVTPKSVLMLGSPSLSINHSRDYLRKELTRLGYPVFEPYKSDIVHASVVRFVGELSEDRVSRLLDICASFSGKILGVASISHMTVSPGSWKMQPKELDMHEKERVDFSFA